MGRQIYSMSQGKGGAVKESKPLFGGGKDKNKKPETEKPETKPPEIDDKDAVFVLQATVLVQGTPTKQVMGAYSLEKLKEYLVAHGMQYSPAGVVFPIYTVKKVKVER